MDKPLGSRQHGGVTRGGDQLFKLAGLAGIVIDTDRIGDKGHRLAALGRMTDIADKAIFQLPIGQAKILCLLLDLAGIGLLAPANQHIASLGGIRGDKAFQWLVKAGADLGAASHNAARLSP
ncbi:hypothetical protein D3C72_1283780 [compost metagenome]